MRINYLAAIGSGAVSVALNNFPSYNDGNDATPSAGIGAVTPAPPTDLLTNDILLCFVQSSNQAISVPTNSGAGTWAEVTNSPQSVGVAVNAGSVRLGVFWMRYNGVAIGTVTVADTGDHTIATIQNYRGCITTGNPWNATSGQTETGTTTTVTLPSLTTTVGNCLIVGVIANAVDTLTGQFGSVSSAGNLTADVGFTGAQTLIASSAAYGTNTSNGTGGGVDHFAGRLVAAGSAGAVQATMTNSSANYAEMMIALTSN